MHYCIRNLGFGSKYRSQAAMCDDAISLTEPVFIIESPQHPNSSKPNAVYSAETASLNTRNLNSTRLHPHPSARASAF